LAKYRLHDLIALAFAPETIAFQAGEIYRSAHSSHRRSATNSFQIGLARGINQKLQTLRKARDAAGVGSNGRALVPIKHAMIDDEMERLGLTFHRRSTARRRVTTLGTGTAGIPPRPDPGGRVRCSTCGSL
jgi:hypothetical protein